MQTYLVGGAVRDRLLGLPAAERDWVVVGATPEALEQRGFRRVGREFPVFLHPETGEEYALARTERKTGPGYRGFVVHAEPSVTLEEDLGRRDLTINAIAEAGDGSLLDPTGGRVHLEQRLLHHISDAFREDPVRILRVARFAARFHPLGFQVAPATLRLMFEMVNAGEAAALIPERVWQETEKALATARPDVYFSVLRACGALAVVFPEIDRLFGVPQPPRWHPEIDTGLHVLLCLEQAARMGFATEVRFAVLVHDLGKGTTPAADLPSHPGHEQRSADLLSGLCTRLAVPNRYRELALVVARHHGLCHRIAELRPATLLKLLEELDAFRQAPRVVPFIDACESDARGRTGLEDRPYPQREWLLAAWRAAQAVDTQAIAATGRTGPDLGAAIRNARLAAIGRLEGRDEHRREQ
jgi:tRNA nucleotidyltransferase (CCA-adding enzyme)